MWHRNYEHQHKIEAAYRYAIFAISVHACGIVVTASMLVKAMLGGDLLLIAIQAICLLVVLGILLSSCKLWYESARKGFGPSDLPQRMTVATLSLLAFAGYGAVVGAAALTAEPWLRTFITSFVNGTHALESLPRVALVLTWSTLAVFAAILLYLLSMFVPHLWKPSWFGDYEEAMWAHALRRVDEHRRASGEPPLHQPHKAFGRRR